MAAVSSVWPSPLAPKELTDAPTQTACVRIPDPAHRIHKRTIPITVFTVVLLNKAFWGRILLGIAHFLATRVEIIREGVSSQAVTLDPTYTTRTHPLRHISLRFNPQDLNQQLAAPPF